MHISLPPASVAPRVSVDRPSLDARIAWLRDEAELAETPEHKASIRNEIGVLEQSASRDAVAVRDYLAAVNAVPRFKEPLERLIAMIERRRSFKNLPTVLDHLCRTADSMPEVARAELAHAWLCIMHTGDEAHALRHVNLALDAVPTDPSACLTLEILARRQGDPSGLRDALARSLAAARDPRWGSLLGIELSDSDAALGAYDQARSLLEAVVSRGGKLGFRALQRCAALGNVAQRPDWTIQALEAQMARLGLALSHPEGDEARAVPAMSRNASNAVDVLIQLAELERREGRHLLALAALERGLEFEPQHPVLRRMIIELAARIGKHAHLESLIPEEIAQGTTATESAGLWLLLAESRMARNESAAALDAALRALAADPLCSLARVTELDLLRGTRDARGYASAFERLASLSTDARARSRYWLLAATTWALEAQDRPAAEAALRLAKAASPETHASERLARGLAHALRDDDWIIASTQSLLADGLTGPERMGALLELWRLAELRKDEAEAERLLARIAELPEGRLFARLTTYYGVSAAKNAATPGATLEELEREPNRVAALGWVRALRTRIGGDAEKSVAELENAHARHPKSAAVAGTLSAWLAERPETVERALRVLRASAASNADDAFAASLYIEAGIRSWQSGENSAALGDFEAAERRGAGCAWALASWTRRASEDTFPVAEETTPSSEPRQRLLAALERAVRARPAAASHLTELTGALRGVGEDKQDSLAAAGRLLTLFVARALGTRADLTLLDRFAAYHPDALQLTDAWRYLDSVAHGELSPKTLEESARRWFESSGSLAAVLEWIAAAARLGNRKRECEARRRLSEHLSGPLREQCATSAAIVAHWSQVEPAPFLNGTSPQVRLTNLETSPPGSDPRRRARALDGAAELLGGESEPIARLLQGYNLLAIGDDVAAAKCFRTYTEAFPNDPAGFEGLLAAARKQGDPILLAETTAALGNTSRDPVHAARLFEEAADIFLERSNDVPRAHAALEKAVTLDIARTSSFTRWFAIVRDSGDTARFISLIERRFGVTKATEELVTLHWEHARALRKQGDTQAALAALDRLSALEPRHAGALALYGEIHITNQRYPEAAEKLAQLCERADVPSEERLTSGLAAVDIYENQLSSTKRALEVLLTLHRAGLSTLSVRERLARAAAKSEAWDEAVVVLEQLMFERNTNDERAEAARLALAIHRDRRQDPRSAGHAAEVLLGLLPHDAEALDLALSSALEPMLAQKLLAAGRTALSQKLCENPLDLDSLRRLSQIADRTGDAELRQITLGALQALGQGQPTTRAELTALDPRIHAVPAVAISDELFGAVAHPEEGGAIARLLAQVAPHLSQALGPTPATFKVKKRDRISASAGMPVRNAIAAWVGAYGLGEFELYISGMSRERIAVVATKPIFVVIGAGVNAPLGPFQRQELVRALYALRRGLSALIQLEPTDVLALVGALCKLGGVTLDGPEYARQEDFVRQLAKALPRKLRTTLPELAGAVRAEGQDAAVWVRAAISSLDRAAVLAVGDVSIIVDDLVLRVSGATRGPSDRMLSLLRFVFSPEYPMLRQRFGAVVR